MWKLNQKEVSVPNIFFISDTHFSHINAIRFLNYDGSRMRPFDTWEEADEVMIENWNKVVQKDDKIYHLGDVCFNRNKGDEILSRLNGNKILIKGNHDRFKPLWYLKYFKDIRACHNLHVNGHKYNYLLTHIPVHPESKARFIRNIHGHIHGNTVTKTLYDNCDVPPEIIPDLWYRNVCEDYKSLDYTPVAFEDIEKETKQLIEEGVIIPPKERKNV